MQEQPLTSALVSELDAIQESGQIYVVDLIFVTKAADGAVTMREMSELIEEAPGKYGNIAGNLMGLLTKQDIEQLTAQVPPAASAFVILFEHAWVIGLAEAVRQAGGVVFSGGMVSHEVLAQVSEELAAAGKDGQNA
jgi:chemotaxis regulatin CheY-phosphate phosphatase CheZ